MRVAYIQPIGGASGDMLLGALVDTGFPVEKLRQGLSSLGTEGYSIVATEDTRCEVRGTHLKVQVSDRTRHTPAALMRAVSEAAFEPVVKKHALAALDALWQAEARVHGMPASDVELEELGSVDTLVDVVGTCLALHELGVEKVYAAPLVLGESAPPRRPRGYSNPAPATLELIAAAGAPVVPDSPVHAGAGELTTPTGAALITTLSEFIRPAFSVHRVGVGLGTRDPAAFPNALRVWLGETAEPEPTQARHRSLPSEHPGISDILQEGRVVLLETNLDDASGLVLGYAHERLFALGALDVWHTPVQMKKNRPGAVLSALVPVSLEAAAVEVIIRETPTLGVRRRPVDRYVADRSSVALDTEFGPVSVKVKFLAGSLVSAAPEPDECYRIATEHGMTFQEVYQRVTETARRELMDGRNGR